MAVANKSNKAGVGKPKTQFSYALDGKKIADEQIKEWLCELVCGDGFPYGYKKLTAALVDDYHCSSIIKKFTAFARS